MTERLRQPLSISGDMRGVRALSYLIDPKHPPGEAAGELLINMSTVTAVDALSGAVVCASIEEHLARGRKANVCIWEPKGEVWETLHDLLGPLPPRCAWPNDVKRPIRDARVFLPAQVVDDMASAELLSRYLRMAGPSAGLSAQEAGYLATAMPALVDNGLRHAGASPCGVVVCGAVERESGDGQLVALDLGDTVSGAEDPFSALSGCLAASRRTFGGLTNISRLAVQAQLDVSLTISSGTARSTWRRRWRHEHAQFAPGWCAAISVHPTQPRQAPRCVGPLPGRQ